MMCTAPDLVEALFVIRSEILRSPLEKDLRESIDLAQGSPQVMRDRIAKCIQLPVANRQFRESGIQFCVELTNFFFLDFSIADVPDRGGYKSAFFRFQWTQADLNRNLVSVLVQAIEFQPSSHRPCARRGKEVGAMSRMIVAKPSRNKLFDFSPQQFFSPVPQPFLT